MKTNTLCWLPESTYLNEDSKKLLIDEGITPLLDSSYSTAIWEKQGKPEWALRYYGYGAEWRSSGVAPYLDEPISCKTETNAKLKAIIYIAENEMRETLTIGETCTEYIQQLVDAGCKSISFTCYGWHLWRVPIINLNIRMPFTTQLNTWKYLEKKYNGLQSETKYTQLYDRCPTKENFKFIFCWIMLDQVADFGKLIKWCKDHDKTIGLVAPDKHKDNPEWVYNQLTKFIKVYKEVASG